MWKSLGALRFPGKRVYNIGDVPFEIQYQIPSKGKIIFSLDNKEYLISGIENQASVFMFLLNGEKCSFTVSEVIVKNTSFLL
ncbi:MAG: hypothetical protein HC905_08395 [Bacteroidales bacterium]|nr:hypothetical protein [Bacteroidales bacterium]